MSSKNLKKLIRSKPKSKDPPKKNSKSRSITKLCNCRAISWMIWQRVPKCCCTTKKCLTAKLQLKKSASLSSAPFPYSWGEQNEYLFETHQNYLMQRSLYLNTNAINDKSLTTAYLWSRRTHLKNSLTSLKSSTLITKSANNLVADFGKDSIKVPCWRKCRQNGANVKSRRRVETQNARSNHRRDR